MQLHSSNCQFKNYFFASQIGRGGPWLQKTHNILCQVYFYLPTYHIPTHLPTYIRWTASSMEQSTFFFLKSHISAPGERNCPNFFFSDFSNNIEVPNVVGKIRHIWFFAPGCLNNCGQGWSFSVILAWDNQKGTFLTHFFNFGHEGAPNVTKITYNMIIWWENSPRKKNWGSFVHRGLRYDFLRRKNMDRSIDLAVQHMWTNIWTNIWTNMWTNI